MAMKRVLAAGGLLLGVLLVSVPAQAQVGAARGKVVDDKGQAIEGAKIEIDFTGGVTRKTDVTTNKKGEFTRVGLAPGNYRVTASKEGFAPQFADVHINLGDPTEIPDFKLVPAGKAAAAAGGAQAKEGEALQASFNGALKAAQEGRFDEAEALYKEVLAKNPGKPEVVWTNLGLLYTQKKDAAAAEEAFKKAIELKPDFAGAYSGLANLLITSGKGPQAAAALTKASTDFPDDPKIQFVYAWTLFSSGQALEAEAVFKKVETLDPQNAEVFYYLGSIAVGQNKIPEAITDLEKYLSLNPVNAQNVATAKGLIAALKPKK
jgi:cytochrome c-type biogenesis protein CcmH/NrfG